MSRVLVNIRGCNGAGKSTIPMSMMDDPNMEVVGPKGQKLTIFPTYGWIALGTYFNKTGGLDTYKNNDAIWSALTEACLYTEFDILMEGVIASTIKSTYANLFHEIKSQYPERSILVISFMPPVETCIQRVYERNGGKAINELSVRRKWRTVELGVPYFKNLGFTSLRINTEVPKDEMLPRFLGTIDKYREG